MYLSRIWLNPKNRRVQRDISDIHQMHRTVMSLFPDSIDTNPRMTHSILYRQEIDSPRGSIYLLVQSTIKPDLASLSSDYLDSNAANEEQIKEMSPLLDSITDGISFVFRARTNPTKKVSQSDPITGEQLKSQRVDIRSEEDQRNWFYRQADRHGFRVDALQIQNESRLTGRRGISSPNNLVTVSPTVFNGVLQVSNTDDFREAITGGIGPGKAYGCGLMSIAKA